jgi:hypothetical protein
MAKTYRVNSFVRVSNGIVTALLRRGVKLGAWRCSPSPAARAGNHARRQSPSWNGKAIAG